MKTTTFRMAIAAATLAVTSQLSGLEWNGDVSALYLPDEKDTGVAVAVGPRVLNNHYVGAELIYFRIRDNLSGRGFSAIATSESYSSGITYKYLMPFSQRAGLFGYAGGGIGLTNTDVSANVRLSSRSVSVSDRSSDNFSYQFLAGVQGTLTERASLKFGWRYLRVDNVKFRNLDYREDFDTHAIELGVKFRF